MNSILLLWILVLGPHQQPYMDAQSVHFKSTKSCVEARDHVLSYSRSRLRGKFGPDATIDVQAWCVSNVPEVKE